MARKNKQTGKTPQNIKSATKSSDFLSAISSFPVAASIITGLVLVIYFQLFSFEIGKLDEDHLILNNQTLFSDFSNWKTAVSTDAFFGVKSSNFYRPVQNLSFLIDGQIGGGSPWSFYLTNILLHILTCITLLSILKRLKINENLSFAMVLFFAATPLFSHSIAWLPARGDLLIGLFGGLSFLFLLEFLKTKNLLFVLLHLITFAIAVFSKETAILLPIIFFTYNFLTQKKKFNSLIIASLIGYAAVILFFLNLRSDIASTTDTGNVFFIAGLFANLQVFPELIAKYFVPYNLSPMPAYNLVVTILGIVFISVLIRFVLKLERGQKLQSLFGLMWFVLFIVPGAMYVHAYKSASYAYLEHRAYLPAIGMCIALSYLLSSKQFIKNQKQIIYSILAITVIYSGYSLVSISDYKDPVSFYNLAIKTNPNSAMAYYNRGIKLKAIKKDEEALSDYNRAIELKTDYAEPLINRGVYRKDKGDNEGAIKDFEEGLKYNFRLPEAHYNLALLQNGRRQYQEALLHCRDAIALNPNLTEPYMLMGNIYFALGDFKSAIESYNKNIQIKADAGVYNNRGSAEFLANLPKEALADFSKAIEMKPDYADAYKNRGMTRNSMNDRKGACEDWQQAAKYGNKEAEMLLTQLCR